MKHEQEGIMDSVWDTELNTAKRIELGLIELGLVLGMTMEEVEQEVRDMIELAPEMAEDHRMSTPLDLLSQGPRTKVRKPGAVYWPETHSFWYPQQEIDALIAGLEAEIAAIKEPTDA